MKKILLMLAMMLPCLGAWAQLPAGAFAGCEVTFTNIQQDGTTKYTLYINEDNVLALSTSSAEELGAAAKFFVEKRANNKYSFYNREKELYMIWRGKGNGYNSDKGVLGEYNATYCDWTINTGTKIENTYYIVSKRNGGTSDGSLIIMKSGVFDAYNNSEGLAGNYSNLYNIEIVSREYVADPAGFENGKLYTFVTTRGWMGAKDGCNNVISTAKHTSLTPNKEDANFQWTVYKSENGNYYLYNVGKDMFMGVQAANNTSVPFAACPAGKKLTFKVSSSLEYPIMFSTNNAAVANHSTNHGDGLISWTGGWGTLNDGGSNHKVEVAGDLSTEVLAKIEKLVAVREIGYFRLKGHSGNYIDASATWGSNGQMSMKAEADCNPAGAIFYYDDNNGFLNYANGRYINETRTLAANNAMGNTWSVYISATEGKYKLLSSANNWLHDNSGNRADRCSSEGDHANTTHSWILEKVTSLPVTITAAKYATFYAPVAVEVPAEVKAYAVTIDGEWAKLNEVGNVIPSNTGVVLYAETAGTYYLAITDDVAAISGNALRGTAATTYFTEAGSYYVLANKEGEVGFYKDSFSSDRFQNNSHKAYLYVPSTSAASAFKFRFEDGTTAIESVLNNGADANAPIYDLSGRRVMNAVKGGIYIQNGKKFIVK